jgi:hypothetical protein
MKKIYNLGILIALMILGTNLKGQDWTIKSGDLAIKAKGSSGAMLDVVAILDEGDDCFMDVKAINGSDIISVKLISTDSMYIPVMAVTAGGKTMPIVAVSASGEVYDVKGVSRAGNTINIAAIVSGSLKEVHALSPDGKKRLIAGVKFQDDNIEMEIGDTKVVAHVKALPTTDVKTSETAWDIKATGNDGFILDVVAINSKGKEYKVKALSAGGSFTLLNVKADIIRDMINVKLTKNDDGIFLTAIDYFGRLYPVKVKAADGTYLDIRGAENCGKTIDIRANSPSGVEYYINAISPVGDQYDVKGIKIMDEDNEGYLQGHTGLVFYYAHVKALPPIE